MEPNRTWHDPEVEIYGNLITPRVGYAAEAYDLANRRWYRLEVTEPRVPEDEWLSGTVADHVRAYHDTHGQAPPWNTIMLTARHAPAATYQTLPEDEQVARPIRKSLSYGSARGAKLLPTTSVDELQNLSYISRSADRCTWRGQDCVFKRIEFDVDIRVMQDEIRAREKLIDAILGDTSSDETGQIDINAEMTRRFLVVPILAMTLAREAAADTPALDIITVSHLRHLIRGMRELAKVGVQHGDIKYWNTVLQPLPDDGSSRLALIDIGTEAPEYEGDAKALGQLFHWYSEDVSGLRASKEKILAAAEALGQEDFEAALQALSAGQERLV
ncbi:hypothetical protein N658DRAFT_523010 [Parathielavia hyrcaniae]|uniref:Protein kinase domain-containing protein n=1 Tax=Parathielavia hyrcaniae TaxID=113614 RepID=A0AAN6Q2J5_9PEZI|nr:hypothetical protein N658DRAFT_523010 [Parathielavia hyrcaniae]